MNKIAQIDFDSLSEETSSFQYNPGDIGQLVSRLFAFVLTFAGIFLLVYLIFGGFRLMTASGDPKKMQEGQHIVTNALIGFVIVFISFWLVEITSSLLGLQTITEIF